METYECDCWDVRLCQEGSEPSDLLRLNVPFQPVAIGSIRRLLATVQSTGPVPKTQFFSYSIAFLDQKILKTICNILFLAFENAELCHGEVYFDLSFYDNVPFWFFAAFKELELINKYALFRKEVSWVRNIYFKFYNRYPFCSSNSLKKAETFNGFCLFDLQMLRSFNSRNCTTSFIDGKCPGE